MRDRVAVAVSLLVGLYAVLLAYRRQLFGRTGASDEGSDLYRYDATAKPPLVDVTPDPTAQARQCFDNIAAVLAEAGASLADIVSLRCFLTDKSAYQGYAEVKGMLFQKEAPASTTVIINALLVPDLLMEVEAVAWSGQLKSNY